MPHLHSPCACNVGRGSFRFRRRLQGTNPNPPSLPPSSSLRTLLHRPPPIKEASEGVISLQALTADFEVLEYSLEEVQLVLCYNN
ncbi:hypothetical protein RIF29_29855 [Crotalaria pallida]|uniref:Uncharacterized protein n=1 Tax=Crotalaria pallida TaxID=3830 RepID=A0AAN9EKG3_CROPI